jgi:hypothetical protein
MWTEGLIAPIFTLAIERGLVGQAAGILALGGIPPIGKKGPFISTPILKTSYNVQGQQLNTPSTPIYQFYTIVPDGIVYGSSNGTSYAAPPSQLTFNNTQFQFVVDSGTSLNIIPASIADAIAALYIPPGVYEPGSMTYRVNCDAMPPHFGIRIGGQTMYINPKDMIFKSNGACRSTIRNGREAGPWLLGEPFFRNVVAVFDIGAGQLRFAGREYY